MQTELWRAVELTFTANGSYARPFQEIDLVAEFLGPGGERLTRPAFWDGGTTWKVRFAPTRVGAWRYRTRANRTDDTGLHGQIGTITCTPYRGTHAIYRHGFLRCAERHLTYRDGTPFLWLADTQWLWESEPYDTVFLPMAQKRLAQGFTVYQVELFQRWKDVQPDLAHFQENIDRKWQFLAENGIVVAVTHGLLDRPTTAAIGEREAQLARYLCARYGAYPTVWLMFQECTGHYAQWFNSPAERRAFMAAVERVGRAYKAADDYHHPRTAHSDSPLLTSYRGSDWLDFTLLQGGHEPVIDRDGYFDLYFENRKPLPQIEGEANYERLYEGANPGLPPPVTTDDMREKAYQAMQCGCAGYSYGANGVWQAVLGPSDSELHKVYGRTLWLQGINLPGGDQLTHWKRFYSALPWHRLQPRPACDGFLTTTLALPPRQQPAVAADRERTTVVVYFYRGSATAGQLHHLTAPNYRARWFDPRTGQYRELGNIGPQQGSVAFPPKPDENDWLLVLTAPVPRKVKLAAVPSRWRQEQERRQAEKVRNCAPSATVTASSTDLIHKVYAPQHAVDGRTNTADWAHWSSEGSAPLPAWLELTWEQPVALSHLRLYFMRNYEVSDYTIEGDGVPLVTVSGNHETIREHPLRHTVRVQRLRFIGRRGPDAQPSIIRVVELETLRPR